MRRLGVLGRFGRSSILFSVSSIDVCPRVLDPSRLRHEPDAFLHAPPGDMAEFGQKVPGVHGPTRLRTTPDSNNFDMARFVRVALHPHIQMVLAHDVSLLHRIDYRIVSNGVMGPSENSVPAIVLDGGDDSTGDAGVVPFSWSFRRWRLRRACLAFLVLPLASSSISRISATARVSRVASCSSMPCALRYVLARRYSPDAHCRKRQVLLRDLEVLLQVWVEEPEVRDVARVASEPGISESSSDPLDPLV